MENTNNVLQLFNNDKFHKDLDVEIEENIDYLMVSRIKEVVDNQFLSPSDKINFIMDLIFGE